LPFVEQRDTIYHLKYWEIIASVLVRFNHIARLIINANHSIM